jgi:hypothetical protein
MIMLQHLCVNNIANVHIGRCIFMSILPPIYNQQFHPLGAPNARHGQYNWPCVNIGLGRKMPTIFNVCPCALLMVMPNAGCTGNWRRRKVKGIRSVSEGVMLSRGMNIRWPFAGPIATSTSMTCYMSWMTMNLVPLAMVLVMLRNNMMGQPSYKCSSWGGMPEKPNVFKNSVG